MNKRLEKEFGEHIGKDVGIGPKQVSQSMHGMHQKSIKLKICN